MDKPSFLKDSVSSSAPKDPQPNRPQKEGSSSDTGSGTLDTEKFPNRPQKTGEMSGNPKSVPDGGKLPFPGPPPAPKTPWKLGK